jgi:hypothetical protein
LTSTTNNPLQDLTDHTYVELPWLHTLRTFLRHQFHHHHKFATNSTITTNSLFCPNVQQRNNDQAIMTALQRQRLSTRQLEIINECRIWLHVISLAEIVNTAGTESIPYAVNGTADTNNRPLRWHTSYSKFVWPNTTRPNNKAWKR